MMDSNFLLPAGLPAGGTYRLSIRLSRPATVTVGRLGRFRLPAGVYVYCGSARRNLPARIARHLRRRKCKRWHIDYLLAHPAARVMDIRAWAEATPQGRGGRCHEGGCSECDLVAEAVRRGGRALIPGFGSSDCRRGCPAHLIRMPPPKGPAARQTKIAAAAGSRRGVAT